MFNIIMQITSVLSQQLSGTLLCY